MMESYEELLKRARDKMPKEVSEEAERFEVPKFDSFILGKETIIKNFSDVARTLERDPAHLQKFILGGAGASGEMDGHRLKFMGNRSTEFLNQKLEEYVKEFVICKQCGKPDTELRKEQTVDRIKCKACSAKYTVRKV
jgi:translation initiation factor 2 subunit 2